MDGHIYMLSGGDYSDHRVDDLLLLPRPLTAEDAAAFDAYSKSRECWDRIRDGHETNLRGLTFGENALPHYHVGSALRDWLIAERHAVPVEHTEFHDGDVSGLKQP
jgi:hypothetical protein